VYVRRQIIVDNQVFCDKKRGLGASAGSVLQNETRWTETLLLQPHEEVEELVALPVFGCSGFAAHNLRSG